MTSSMDAVSGLMRRTKAELAAEVVTLRGRIHDLEKGADDREARLLDAIESFSEALVLFDDEGRLIHCNSGYKDLYGYSDDEARPGTQREDLDRLDFERGVIALEGESEKEFTLRRQAFRNELQGSFEFSTRAGRHYLIRERAMAGGGAVVVQADITERKRAEEALRDSEERLISLLDESPIGVAITKISDRRVVFGNERMADMFGIDRFSLVGSEARDFYDDEDDLRQMLIDLQRDGGVRDREVLFKRKDGRAFWALLTTLPFRYGDEAARISWFFDIDERKRAEQKLAESQEHSQALADYMQVALSSMSDGIYILDGDLNIVAFNQRYVDLLNFPEGLVREGGSIIDVTEFAARRGDYGSQFEGDVDDVVAGRLKQMKSNEEYSIENITPTGRIVEYRGSPIKGGGFVSIMHDITERRQAEEALRESEARLKGFLDHANAMVVIKDTDLRYIMVNKAFAEERGLLAENFIGKTAQDMLPAERVEEIEEIDREVLETGKPLEYESHMSNANGERRENFVIKYPVFAEDGSIVAIGSFATDITARKHAEAALEEAYGIIKDQRDRMEDELNVGREIQMSMIPLSFPPFPDRDEFSIDAVLEPAREVGGDFYDFYFIDEDRLCVCIGDVSGKGVPSALFMAVAKTLIKSRAVDDHSTASIMTHVNAELSRDNPSCMFVTIFIGILDVGTGELIFTNAGHNPPYVKRGDGAIQRLDQRHGPVIGAVEDLVYAEERVVLAPGDVLYVYTDGVTEAMDGEGALYSEERLADWLASTTFHSTEAMVRDTVAAVEEFEGEAEQADDITVMALRFVGNPEDAPRASFAVVAANELPEIARVRTGFEDFADEAGVPAAVAVRFALALDELLSNIISHAYRDDDAHAIEVKVELTGRRLTLTVADDGIPFNPLLAEVPDTDASIEDRDVGGLGIHLVQSVVDDFHYHRRIDKNVVTLIKELD